MKKILFSLLAAVLTINISMAQNNMGVGASPDPSAKLDVSATDKGILVPRMTKAQRDAIASPATSLLIYQTDDTPGFYYFDGTAWKPIIASSVAVSTYPNVELKLTKTATQAQTLGGTDTTLSGAAILAPYLVTFSSTNNSNATLTGGNTWDGATNKFTVGATGAGWYLVNAQITVQTTNATSYPFMAIIKNGINNGSDTIYGVGAGTGGVWPGTPSHHGRTLATGIIYLIAGDTLEVYAKANSVSNNIINTDGTTNFSVVRLK